MSEQRLADVGTGVVAYCLHQLGYPNCFMARIGPVTARDRVFGRARTLRTLPTRPDVVEAWRRDRARDPHRVALDGTGPGEVLVIDARGDLGAAVMGDVLASRLVANGAAGVVTDGCVRDLPGLEQLDLPVFAAGLNALLFSTRHVGIAVDEPIACGGVLVKPGDLIVGDREGVAVVPAQLVEQLAQATAEQEELDAFVVEKIRDGLPLVRAYPPDASTRAEFDRRRAERGGTATP
jgi:regulator of RNase E activity RraA